MGTSIVDLLWIALGGLELVQDVFGGGPSIDDGVGHIFAMGAIAFGGVDRLDGDCGGWEPLFDGGHACDGMRAAAKDCGEVHGAGVVDDDVRAGAKGVDELLIDETANVRLGDSSGEWVAGACDDLDLPCFA